MLCKVVLFSCIIKGKNFKWVVRMGGIKKNKKILFQLAAIILPLFMLMIAAIVWTVYTSTLNGFQVAQNNHMEELLSDPENHFEFMDEEHYGEDIREWYIEQLEK